MGKKSTVRYVNHCLNLLSDDGVEGNRKLWRFQENDGKKEMKKLMLLCKYEVPKK